MDILPVNVKKSHWVLLAANVTIGEVSILDSLPGTADTYHYIKKFVHHVDVRTKATGDLANLSWKQGTLTSMRQSDGHSCGAFVMLVSSVAVQYHIPMRVFEML
jgi:Ulp1 family protease